MSQDLVDQNRPSSTVEFDVSSNSVPLEVEGLDRSIDRSIDRCIDCDDGRVILSPAPSSYVCVDCGIVQDRLVVTPPIVRFTKDGIIRNESISYYKIDDPLVSRSANMLKHAMSAFPQIPNFVHRNVMRRFRQQTRIIESKNSNNLLVALLIDELRCHRVFIHPRRIFNAFKDRNYKIRFKTINKILGDFDTTRPRAGDHIESEVDKLLSDKEIVNRIDEYYPGDTTEYRFLLIRIAQGLEKLVQRKAWPRHLAVYLIYMADRIINYSTNHFRVLSQSNLPRITEVAERSIRDYMWKFGLPFLEENKEAIARIAIQARQKWEEVL